MYIDLFLKGGLQLNLFVSHHKLLGCLSFGSSLVVRWRKLYFANHQTTCVPEVEKKKHAKIVRVGPQCPLASGGK